MKNLLIILSIIGGILYGKFSMEQMALAYDVKSQKHEVKVQQVAKEERSKIPTTQDILNKLTEVFGVEGKEVLLWAINCSYSESKWRYNAINNTNSNGTIDAGIFQINDVHKMSVPDRMDFEKNIEKAYEIYKHSGKKAWYGSRCK